MAGGDENKEKQIKLKNVHQFHIIYNEVKIYKFSY